MLPTIGLMVVLIGWTISWYVITRMAALEGPGVLPGITMLVAIVSLIGLAFLGWEIWEAATQSTQAGF